MYKRNIEARSCNHCCSGRAISITYSECVSVALVIQYAVRMRRITVSILARRAFQWFFFHFYLKIDAIFEK
jgi:hypothetical protein